MRVLPVWSKLNATANSTPHDVAVMGEFMRGEPLRAGDWAGVTVPTLVLAGGKSEPLLRKAARAIADVLPNAEHRELPKLSQASRLVRLPMWTLVPARADPYGPPPNQQFGLLGVAFTLFTWLTACAFMIVVATVVGAVLAEDPGRLGRFIRSPRR